VVIFIDHFRDDAFSANRSQVGQVPGRLRLPIRGPLPPGLVRPAAVVMAHVLAEHQGQVAFAGDRAPDQHPLDLARALEDREDPGGMSSFRSASCDIP
jgi:hypothetical protein